MAQYTLPLLFLNLGGEMLYVLDQRLRAQNVPLDKARKGKYWSLLLIHKFLFISLALFPFSKVHF